MRKLLVGLILGVLFVVGMGGGHVRAAENSLAPMAVNSFSARYELFNDVRGGRMQVKERVDVTFLREQHGIFRAIPKSYKRHSVHLDIQSVKLDSSDETYTSYTQNDNLVLKIGKPDRFLKGAHYYEVTYELRNVLSFYKEHAEFYWDVNGDQWNEPMEEVRAEVIFPEGWSEPKDLPGQCFTGAFGSKKATCSITQTDRGYVVKALGRLPARSNLTLLAAIPNGLFVQPTAADWLRDHLLALVPLALAGFIFIYLARTWWRYGRDYHHDAVIVPEYEPPKGLSPAEVGMLYDYRVDGRDLTATLIDLCIRGYVRIHDKEVKRLGLFKRHEFSLELRKVPAKELKSYEVTLLHAIFGEMAAGTIVEMKHLNRKRTHDKTTAAANDIKNNLTDDYGYIEKKFTQQKAVMWTILIVCLLLVKVERGALFGLASIWALLIVGLGCLIFIPLMRRRSHAGNEMYGKILGLRLYLTTAEADRLKKMQGVDRPYDPPAATVHLFEKLLPYAIALGVEKSWAKQFKDVYKTAPDWYDGNFTTGFYHYHFIHHLTYGTSQLNTSFSAPRSASGSGFSGGGFSGGGGGGGGGGSW